MSAISSIPVARRALHRAAAVALLLAPAPLAAQDAAAGRELARRIAAAPDGIVRLSYPAAEGVCGNGQNVRMHGGSTIVVDGRRVREWESDCEEGPVRLSLTVAGGEVTALRSYVGGRWADAEGVRVTDLGTVPAAAAAGYLLDLAERGTGEPAQKAIFPAVIAEGVTVWPTLLRIARDERRPRAVRQDAVFWVSQAAGEAVTRGLNDLVDEQDADLDVRERAVFALSQRPADEAVPALIRVARTSPSKRLRGRAVFWLGQSKDPRALAFLEEVLSR